MKNFIRVLSVLLIAAMAFSAVACSSDEDATKDKATLDLGSGDPSASGDGSSSLEDPSSNGNGEPTVDPSDVPDNQLTTPTLSSLAVPTTSSLMLSAVAAPASEDCTTLHFNRSSIYAGELILVNSQHAIQGDPEELTNIFQYRAEVAGSGTYALKSDSYVLQESALVAFTAMMADYYAQMQNNYVQITESYRTYDDQNEVYQIAYQEYGAANVGKYALKPNNSDFRTGYSVHLNCYKDGLNYKFSEKSAEPYAAKIAELADNYGFIQRYPNGKSAYTGIVDKAMPYLYRYVGVPHARVMTEGNYSLEEYIAGIKNYTENSRLQIVDGEHTYHVFYVPANAEGTTEIRIPKIYSAEQYSISGNNVDGFIVTITVR